MIALPKHKMTADEFLAWAETLPKEAGKFELWDGEVIVKHGPVGQQNAERSQHWEVKGATFAALREAIKRAGLPCFAAIDGASVRLSHAKLVEPDVLVYCGEKVPRGVLEVPNPLIVVGQVDADGGFSFCVAETDRQVAAADTCLVACVGTSVRLQSSLSHSAPGVAFAATRRTESHGYRPRNVATGRETP